MSKPNDVFLPASLASTDAGMMGFYLHVEAPLDNSKSLVAVDITSGDTFPLHPEAMNFGALSSCGSGGNTYLACTLTEGANRSVLLFVRTADGCRGPFFVTQPGKADNPTIAIHDEDLHICWEEYAEKTRIMHTSLLLNDGLTEATCAAASNRESVVSDGSINAYRPRLASNGTHLLLAYEGFMNERYHVLAHHLQGGAFSEAVDVGSADKNDQEPSLSASGEGFYLAFENSSPLYKDYVWVSPSDERIIIPAFGHGWRVEAKQYVKHMSISDAGIAVHVPPVVDDNEAFPRTGPAGRVWLDDKESSGCPVVLGMGDSSFILIFAERTGQSWNVHYTTFHNGEWSSVVDTGISQKQRVPPAAQYDVATGELTILSPVPAQSDTHIYRQKVGSPGVSDVPLAMEPMSTSVIELVLPTPERRSIQYHGEELKLFWGDLHMHSNISGCSLHPRFHCTEIEEKYRQCRDVGRLDFAMCTDHDSMNNHEWARTRAEADFHNRPGFFTAFQGFEWTSGQNTPAKQGHYNVLYRSSGRLYRLLEDDGNDIRKVWEYLEEGEALTIPHHPADAMHPLDWTRFNPQFEPLVEIFQVRGSYEYPGNSMDPSNYRSQGMVPGLSIVEALEKGYAFGFTSGGEHEGVGVTCVLAEANTRDAIFGALRKRHVYGTTGDRIFLDFRLNGQLMGEELAMPEESPELSINVYGTAPIRNLRIMRDGEKVYECSSQHETIDLTWRDDRFSEIHGYRPIHYYYVVVEQENEAIAWASPVFLKEEQ